MLSKTCPGFVPGGPTPEDSKSFTATHFSTKFAPQLMLIEELAIRILNYYLLKLRKTL